MGPCLWFIKAESEAECGGNLLIIQQVMIRTYNIEETADIGKRDTAIPYVLWPQEANILERVH